MTLENSEEFLGIMCKEKNYVIELKWIVQICTDVQISLFPCLPPYCVGMYNYKGEIIPVISLEEQNPRILLVIKCGEGLFAIGISREPSILAGGAMEAIDTPHTEELSGIWAEKALYQVGDMLFSLIDIERTVEKISV